ncbi:hypothetical protein L873DRAFT_1809293 [Choiromyces venosus 120613-1]|uniref:Uncharacterized protein n=1 Tax=Choiromyces venosus 120613-1 TaxID=1336337 RepID=A0A3N4JHS6_9PEZI|nr:hypothetical protein L873DRAFT_1809293 [Choiromyces venosus 120613-1]
MSLDLYRNLLAAAEDGRRWVWVWCGVGGREDGVWGFMQPPFRLTYWRLVPLR